MEKAKEEHTSYGTYSVTRRLLSERRSKTGYVLMWLIATSIYKFVLTFNIKNVLLFYAFF